MRFHEKMAAQEVRRWHTIEVSRQQSLAEHSFNVTMLMHEILTRSGINCFYSDLKEALHHDLHEITDGDLPANGADVPEVPAYPAMVALKAADLIDAHVFIYRYGIGPRAQRAATGLGLKIEQFIHMVGKDDRFGILSLNISRCWKEFLDGRQYV